MATLRHLEIPDALYHSIERRAGGEGISVEQLLVRELAQVERMRLIDEDNLLDEIRKDRAAMAAKGVEVTDELIREARNWGRE